MSRIKLFIIFAAFLGPLLAAFVWYYGFGGVLGNRDATNNAPLLSPVVPLRAFSNFAVDGARFDAESLRHKWSVIHLLERQCDAGCEKSLYNTRQTRLALGRDANRIRRILLSANRDLLTRLAAAHPDAVRLLESAGGLQNQLAPLLQTRHPGADADAALLVDPLGNLMMIIPATLDPALLLKDLKRLLKLSRIG